MPSGSSLKMLVEDRTDIAHQQAAFLWDFDGETLAPYKAVSGKFIDLCKFRAEVGFGGNVIEIDREIAHEALDDAAAKAVILSQSNTARCGKASIADRLPITDRRRGVLDIAL